MHDIGGPVGFEMAAQIPERVASLTILNTLIEADKFKKPWSMRPFEMPGLDRMWIAPMKLRPMFRMLMNMQGVADRSKVPNEELDAYLDLLFGDDDARAFLKIMKSFEPTPEKSALYQSVVTSDRYPKQVVWGDKDPGLTYAFHGKIAERLTSTAAERLPAKHFLQEDQYDAVAEAIQRIAY